MKDKSEKLVLEPTNVQKVHALPWALTGQTGMSVYANMTMAGPVLLLFLNQLGFNRAQIGLLLGLIPFMGVMSPLFLFIESRFGYKRSYLFTMSIRTLVLASLIATPWVLSHYGAGVTLVFIIAIIAIYSLISSASVAVLAPWMQEFIPDDVRGKYGAISNVTGVLVGSLTVALAGVYLGEKAELSQFATLFAIAFVIGLVSVMFYSFVPGGRAVVQSGKLNKSMIKTAMFDVLKDKEFSRFLIGAAFVTLAWVPVAPGGFLALYLIDVIKLNPKEITLCASIIMGAGIFTSFFWGWAADRYGSKPVMMICLCAMWIFPLALCLIPPSPEYGFYMITGIGTLVGMAMPGWGIGFSRYMYVNLIPSKRRGQYTSTHLAFEGLMGGISPIVAGFVLTNTHGMNLVFGNITIGQYTPIFISSLVLLTAAIVVLNSLPSDSNVSTAKFAGMFLTGHPMAAMHAMYSHSRGGSEQKRMMTIVRLGKAKSPLATTELIESLNDPSPDVRVQTMLTVVSSRPNKKLVDAIIAILDRNEPEMNIAAVWALGLIGDPRAIPAIRKLLKSKYPTLRGRAAIALARLEDRDSVNTLFERFKTDKTVRFAYADAFGILKIKEAIVPIIDYMAEVSDDITRQSLAYSIASIVGDENMYILVLRQIRRNLKDAREEVHYHLRKRLPGISEDPATVRELIDKALMASIKEDFLGVAASFREIISLIPQDRLTEEAWTVINHCLPLYEDQTKRGREFIILVAHALLAGCREESKTSKY